VNNDAIDLSSSLERERERLKAEATAIIDRELAEMARLADKYGFVPVKRDEFKVLQQNLMANGASAQTESDRLIFDGTIANLAHHYVTDERSPYRQLRFKSRTFYDHLFTRILEDCGSRNLADLNAQEILRLYKRWSDDGKKLTVGKARVGMLRTLWNYGITRFEDSECARLSGTISRMRFESPKRRTERLTADHVIAVRAKAHESGLHSIALAQALQFDLELQQKDVIGEWVPVGEAGWSDVIHDGKKWLHGLRWSEIDSDLILRHTTSRQQERIEIDLKNAPMVMEELERRGERPTGGPVINDDATERPYANGMFRVIWRKVADAADIPRNVKNMDTSRGDSVEDGAGRTRTQNKKGGVRRIHSP
jgi:hypothetical protein